MHGEVGRQRGAWDWGGWVRGSKRGFLRFQGVGRGRKTLLRMDLNLPWGLLTTVTELPATEF